MFMKANWDATTSTFLAPTYLQRRRLGMISRLVLHDALSPFIVR
jgi:hypothetical protein